MWAGRHGIAGAGGQHYDDKDGGRCHKRGVADDDDKQLERLFDNARQGQ